MKTITLGFFLAAVTTFFGFTAPKKQIITKEFTVYGKCEMCKQRIEKSVYSLKGVKKVNWNIQTKTIKVTFDQNKVTLNQIHQAISKKGYKTDKLAAQKEGYDKLPGCCKSKGACDAPSQ